MQEKRPPVPVERVAGSNRSVAVATAVVVIGLLLLVAKPWTGTAERRPPSPQSQAAVEAAPSRSSVGVGSAAGSAPAAPATPVPPIVGPELAVAVLARQQCQNHAVWRVVTHERTGSSETSSLFPIIPVVARGPADPSITAATIHASQLLGIGYCIPVTIDRDISAIERQILIWKQSTAGNYAAVSGTRVLDQGLFSLGEAYLGPPDGAPAATWPGGRYVFEIRDVASHGTARWFALDFAPTD